MADEAVTLSVAERQSAVWLKIKAHLERRLDDQRKRNDGNLTADDTAKTRGRIAEIKELLKLGDAPKQVPVEPHID